MGVILTGDARHILKGLPSASVHCVVTSPPYFGLRDYGMVAQIGLEKSPDEYVAELVTVFREVHRVLSPDGTLWLNIGDSYATTPKGNPGVRGNINGGKRDDADSDNGSTIDKSKLPGFKAKDRLMIPARVALALQADGWWLRDEIIWHKPNPMPASVTDRTTPAHEMIYTLSKSARYFYNMEAIKEPTDSPRRRANGVSVEDQGRIANKQSLMGRQYAGFNERYFSATANCGVSETRQPRSVWTITPKPFTGAHFATFPTGLVHRCVKAGCPPWGTVLDPFFGSGTVGLVADNLGLQYIGIELNPKYVAIAQERLRKRFPWE